MVILEHTTTKLSLRHQPFFIWLLTAGVGVGIPISCLVIGVMFDLIFYLWWLPFFFLGCLGLSFLLLRFAGETIIITFDKERDRVTIKQRALSNTKQKEETLANILDVQIQCKSWNTNDRAAIYHIILLTRIGKSLTIDLGMGTGLKEQQKTVNLIRDFLGMTPIQWSWYALPPSKLQPIVELSTVRSR